MDVLFRKKERVCVAVGGVVGCAPFSHSPYAVHVLRIPLSPPILPSEENKMLDF